MLVLKGHATGQTVHSIAFAPDGASLASTSLDGTIRLWDLLTGTNQIVGRIFGYASRSVAFSPDARTLAWVSQPGAVHVGHMAYTRWHITTHELDSGTTTELPMDDDEFFGDLHVRSRRADAFWPPP